MKNKSHKHLQEALDNDSSCYVLITCGNPSKDGQMQVEMTYQGDKTLALCLLQGAQTYIDQEDENIDPFSDALRLVKCQGSVQ